MREKIEDIFDNSEGLNVKFSGKELAYLLVNLRASIKTMKTFEQEREKYLKNIIKSPIYRKEQLEEINNIEQKLNSGAPEFIEENATINLLPSELNQLIHEVNERISIIETDKKITPVIEHIKEAVEKSEEKNEIIKELGVLKTIKLKLEKLIGGGKD